LKGFLRPEIEGTHMTGLKLVALAAFAGCAIMATAPQTAAQIGIEIGVAPECPYGIL
jgi:hypothetical protein